MKIHIVQKGDTLWELSKQYGVDFEQLKQVNSHLSSPDMIMPGMKIKIPSTSKSVKKESMQFKEKKKETVKHPYKDMSPKPVPVMEDDKKEQKLVKPEMPMPEMPMPEMPMQPMMQMQPMEQDFDFNNYTTINIPQMPQYKMPKKEEPKKEKKEQVKPMPLPYPEQPAVQQPVYQPMPGHMVPFCCYAVHPCFPPIPFQVMGHMDGFMPAQPMHQGPNQTMAEQDCGCGSKTPDYQQYAMDPFVPGSVNQGYNVQPDLYNAAPMSHNPMYPPQFGNAPLNPYPAPPEFPNFSAPFNRTEDDEPKTE